MVSVDLPASEEMAALVVSAAPVEMALVATVEVPFLAPRAPAATERAAMAAMAVMAVTAATLMAALGLAATAASGCLSRLLF